MERAPPLRTVQAPGSTQALTRSEVVDVGVTGLLSGRRSTGRVRRLDLLGALVIKAAALTEIATRTDPARDWQDASLLLSVIPDPVAVEQLCTRRDRRRLQGLTPLLNRSRVGWATLTEEHYRRGAVTLDFLLGR
jgi:hypothetical protein